MKQCILQKAINFHRKLAAILAVCLLCSEELSLKNQIEVSSLSKPIDWLVKIVLSKNFLLGKTTATRRVYIQIDNLNDATIYLEREQSHSLTGTVLCFLVDAIQ